MNNSFWKAALCMLILFAYLIGTIAGIGNCIYIHEYLTALCVLILALMAFPVAKNVWEEWQKL